MTVWRCLLAVILAAPAAAAEPDAPSWPQWGGPNRDGTSGETGLLTKWPAGGPKMLWSADGIGRGWAAPSIAGGTIYVTGLVDGNEVLNALDLDGKAKWKVACGAAWTRSRPGARGQATIADGRAYLITSMVQAWCLDAASGRKIWSADVFGDFKGVRRTYGMAESPLLVDDKMIVTPGGPQATIVALDRRSGKPLWTTKELSQPSTYCSPILVERGGLKIVVTMIKEGLVGVNAADGKVLWTAQHRNKYDNHPVSPMYRDGQIAIVSGYGAGVKMFQLARDGRSITKLWQQSKPDTCHGGLAWTGGYIYGSGFFPSGGGGRWVCLDAETGKVVYEQPWVRMGSVIVAEGNLYCYGEDGVVALVPARPDATDPVGTFRIALGKDEHWAHPVVCGRRLYIRHGGVLMAFDIARRD